MLRRGKHDILCEHDKNVEAANLDNGFGEKRRSRHFCKELFLSHFVVQKQCRTQSTFTERCRHEENTLQVLPP